jgi:hypothetical protein
LTEFREGKTRGKKREREGEVKEKRVSFLFFRSFFSSSSPNVVSFFLLLLLLLLPLSKTAGT